MYECFDSWIVVVKLLFIKVIDENFDIDFGFICFFLFGNGGFIRVKLGIEYSKLKEFILDNGVIGVMFIIEILWEIYLYLIG